MKTLLHTVTGFLLGFATLSVNAQAGSQPNFIFIVVDDLNDYVNPFNNDMPQIITPNIQQLADSGTVFLNGFANAPGCAPSRTSFLSGKDLKYTQVYSNEEYINSFRQNFTEEKGNEEVYTLPEILKDSGGYYTIAISKVFHNPANNDYDKVTEDNCSKIKSWNKMILNDPFDSAEILDPIIENFSFGSDYYLWGPIPDSMINILSDHISADTAIQFIQDYAADPAIACDRPFFLTLGINYPHSVRYVPESYFLDDYLADIYTEPFNYPFNYPINSYPYNGVVMAPQPDTMYQDYYNLPDSGVARGFAASGDFYEHLITYYDDLDVVPEIDPSFDDEMKKFVLEETVKANYLMAYLAAIEYIDDQIGRVIDELYAHPELAENTIIILISDHGYSVGEKRHWEKWGMWDTDIRIPFLIVDPSRPGGQVVNSTVSLIDIFPTVCDLAGVNYPVFNDGTPYLDGTSFVHLLDHPENMYERPVLTTYKKGSGFTSCTPTYSIRDDRFHYISYKLNNDGTFMPIYCDSLYFGYEEELYEIGTHREKDLHEWNNLIDNPDYEPLLNFFHQFLPDSNLYLQTTFKALISHEPADCFLSLDDTLHLSFEWYDTLGFEAEPSASFIYQWTNNLTEDTLYGTEIDFPVDLIGEVEFASNDKMMMYLQAFDSAGQIISLDIAYFYINPVNEPIATFNATFDSLETAHVFDLDISGSYTEYWWDFGTGNMFTNQLPGPFTYPAPGLHTITLYIAYGNDCIKSVSVDNTITSSDENQSVSLTVMPVPADDHLIITGNWQNEPSVISIVDVSGKVVYQQSAELMSGELNINTAAFPAGYYILQIRQHKSKYSTSFIIQHE